MTILIAIEALAEDGDSTQLIDHRGNAYLDQLGVVTMAMCNVRRWDGCGDRRGPGHGPGSWLGRLVGAVEDEVGGVEVQAVAGQVAQVDGLGRHRREDGVALAEESIEGTTQAVIVEAGGGDVPEEVGPGVRGPRGDVDESRRLAEAGGQEQAENAAMGEGQSRVGG